VRNFLAQYHEPYYQTPISGCRFMI